MSRCFPFPPPGYVGSKASNDALIDSIKLPRESEKAIAERKKGESEKAKAERKKEKKEKKREKKEKKKDKKDKSKQYPHGAEDGMAHKIGALDGETQKSLAHSKGIFEEKTRADMDEQMERSGLTEEHQQPFSVHKPSYSSDSTENSKKRKRPASPSRNGGISGHGNVIRIRLPLGKHKEPMVAKEPICSTSGRIELSIPLRKDPPVQAHRIEDKKPICSTSWADQVFTPVDLPPVPYILTPFEKEMQAASLLYNKLVGSFVPPASHTRTLDLDDDQDWLFGRKQKDDRQVEKRHKPNSDLSCRSTSLLQPRAQFLPDVGIHSLPYTLPF